MCGKHKLGILSHCCSEILTSRNSPKQTSVKEVKYLPLSGKNILLSSRGQCMGATPGQNSITELMLNAGKLLPTYGNPVC